MADIFRTRGRGSSNADVRIFGAKTLRFFEIYVVPTRGEEVMPPWNFLASLDVGPSESFVYSWPFDPITHLCNKIIAKILHLSTAGHVIINKFSNVFISASNSGRLAGPKLKNIPKWCKIILGGGGANIRLGEGKISKEE